MAFVWKRAAVIAAGIKGRRKAAMTAYAARQRPITLARVAWLDRPIIPIKDKSETLGADFDKQSAQPERKTMMRESIEAACSWTRRGLISLASTLANSQISIPALRARSIMFAVPCLPAPAMSNAVCSQLAFSGGELDLRP